MPRPRPLLFALALAGGCIQFETPPTTGGTGGPESTTGEPEPPTIACDPLAQSCPEGQACTMLGRDFGCIEVATPGAAGDACAAATECGPGLLCTPAALLAACAEGSCCSSLCDTGDAGVECGGSGETCVALYDDDEVQAAALRYGVCMLSG